MKHEATSRFWRACEQLSAEVQQPADKNYALWRQNPWHPSLHFKKVGRFWSARVGLQHRALAVEDGEVIVGFWISRHDEYDRLISCAKRPARRAFGRSLFYCL